MLSQQSVKTPNSLSLQDRIRLELEDDLRQERLRPGMAIDEAALCVRFGASRTPVREALLVLAAQGLIEIVPRTGIYVRQLGAHELVAMMEALSELEGVLARLAAERAKPPLITELESALAHTAERAQANDAEGYAAANADLHDLIYQASGNAFIVAQTRLIRLRIAPYRGRLFEKPGRLVRSQAEHAAVVDAICRGDSEAAAAAMREHISAGGRVFVDMLLSASAEIRPPARPSRTRRARTRKI